VGAKKTAQNGIFWGVNDFVEAKMLIFVV